MKKIIFKFFLISLFTCVCFFTIDKVYASTSSKISLTEIKYYNNTDSGSTNRPNAYSVEGGDIYYGLLFNEVNYRFNFIYDVPANLLGSYYDVGGRFFANVGSNGFSDVSVTLNGFLCETSHSFSSKIISQSGASDYGTAITSTQGQVWEYSCKNVQFRKDNHFIIRVNSLPEVSAFELGLYEYIYTDISDKQVLLYNNFNSHKLLENQQETNKKLQETNDTLKDDNTSEASGEAESFFSGFSTDTHGLTSIITAPLNLIGSITSSTCSPLGLKVPFVKNKTLNLPCMSSIYKKHFGSFFTIYQTITFGIISYWVCVRIFALVKDFKNPEHDEVEVMDL